MITEDYVSFETAKLLKDKGFPQDPHVCNTAYTSRGNLSNNAKSFVHNSETYARCGVKPLHYSMAPTLQMAMRWLREVHHLNIIVDCYTAHAEARIMTIEDLPACKCRGIIGEKYEKAFEAAIKYCLENLS